MSVFALTTCRLSDSPGAPTGAAAAPNNPVTAGLAPNRPVLPVDAAGAPNPVVAGLAPNPVEVDPKRPPPAAGEGALVAPNPVDAPKVEPAMSQKMIIVRCRRDSMVQLDDLPPAAALPKRPPEVPVDPKAGLAGCC